MDGAFLDWALEALSGSVAVDELSEGPSCVLSAVDNRQDKRMLYEVLDHAPPPMTTSKRFWGVARGPWMRGS
jgi:hypothetical protein